MKRWQLPRGQFVVQDGDTWYFYDAPGALLYAGDAQGLYDMLSR